MQHLLSLRDTLVILIAAVAIVPVFRRFRANAILGYLVAGALIGPHGLGLLRDVELGRAGGRVRRRVPAVHARPRAVGRAHRGAPELRVRPGHGPAHGDGAGAVGRAPGRRRAEQRVPGAGRRARALLDGRRAQDAEPAAGDRDALRPRGRGRAPAPGPGGAPAADLDPASRRTGNKDSAGAGPGPREGGSGPSRHLRRRQAGAASAAPGGRPGRRSRAVHRHRPAARARYRLAHRARRTLHGARRVPRRPVDRRDRVSTSDRGRHPAVPGHSARALLHDRGHGHPPGPAGRARHAAGRPAARAAGDEGGHSSRWRDAASGWRGRSR